jgi:hypothetical protein
MIPVPCMQWKPSMCRLYSLKKNISDIIRLYAPLNIFMSLFYFGFMPPRSYRLFYIASRALFLAFKKSRSRCYVQNALKFSAIFANFRRKMAFFSKTNVMIQILKKTSSISNKKTPKNFSAKLY